MSEHLTPHCGDCRHWHTTRSLQIGEGECRRYPPQAFAMPSNQGMVTGSMWPAVKSDQSCGEHSRRINRHAKID